MAGARFSLWLRLGVLLMALSVAAALGIASSRSGPSVQASDYLYNALLIIRQNSIDSGRVDWDTVYDHAFDLSRTARSTADTYPAIDYAVAALGDWHSRFVPPRQVNVTTSPDGSSAVPTGHRLSTDLAYVAVPSVGDSSGEDRHYTAQGLQVMRTLAAAHPCGWIVDLRGNDGGDMWPMLTTVIPLLDASTVGYFVGPDGQRTPWRLAGGRAYAGTEVQSIMPNTLAISPGHAPVSVLADEGTASSGEAVLISFIGQRGVRTIGQPTAGVPSANAGFSLSDGAQLVLTVASDADRTGHVYPHLSPVVPQVVIYNTAGSIRDDALSDAEAWLRSTSDCSAR